MIIDPNCSIVCLQYSNIFSADFQSRYMSERKLEPKDVPGTFLNLVSQ